MVFWGIVIVLVVVAALLVPFLVREIKKGKAELKPGTPYGAGDVTPGRRSNPAPGQPDAQADPWSPEAHRP
jgi:hypothetical protein